MKIRRAYFLSFFAFIGIAVLIRFVWSDIHLDVDLIREGLERMPGLVMENLEFEREISGDLWYVKVPLAQQRGGKIEVRSVDITRWLAGGEEWYLRSAYGVYSREEALVELNLLLGTFETGSRVLNLESPSLFWSENEKTFLFPEGLTLFDAEFILEADVASIDESGLVVLDKGGIIKWTKNPEQETGVEPNWELD